MLEVLRSAQIIVGEGRFEHFFCLFFKMGHSAAGWDYRAATEITKDWNGIDEVVLRNPQVVLSSYSYPVVAYFMLHV